MRNSLPVDHAWGYLGVYPIAPFLGLARYDMGTRDRGYELHGRWLHVALFGVPVLLGDCRVESKAR